MNQILIGCGWIITSILFTGYLGFVFTSFREERLRPVVVSSILFIPFLSILLILLLVPFNGHILVLTIIMGIIVFIVLVILIPFGKKPVLKVTDSQEKLDERDALFHRFRALTPDMPEYEMYYQQHPEKREFDDMVRKLPSLEEEGSLTYHPLVSLYQKALFDQIEILAGNLDAPPVPEVKKVSTDEITEKLKGFARYMGADLVGSTRLNPAYVYSHVARDPAKWGEPVSLDHQYALVFAVEMNYEMVKHAPWSEVITESAFQYYETAKIATVVSNYIKLLGYDARAHIDQNYRVMCVPIAVDAGLGESATCVVLRATLCS